MPWPIRILIALYAAFSLFAMAVALWDPADDPLSAVFLVIAALPWTIPMGALLDWIGEPAVWVSFLVTATGIALNLLLLIGIGRWLGRRRPKPEHP